MECPSNLVIHHLLYLTDQFRRQFLGNKNENHDLLCITTNDLESQQHDHCPMNSKNVCVSERSPAFDMLTLIRTTGTFSRKS